MSTNHKELGDAISLGLNAVLVASVLMLVGALAHAPLQENALALFGAPAAIGILAIIAGYLR